MTQQIKGQVCNAVGEVYFLHLHIMEILKTRVRMSSFASGNLHLDIQIYIFGIVDNYQRSRTRG